jgi:hypothetical protein
MTHFDLAVNGTLMRGLALNPNLLAVGATFIRETATEPTYRLWSIDDRHPAMMRVPEGGAAIALNPGGGVGDAAVAGAAGIKHWQSAFEQWRSGVGSFGRTCPVRRPARNYRVGWMARLPRIETSCIKC